MIFSALSRHAAPLAKSNAVAMLCTSAQRLPFAAVSSTARRVHTAAPLPGSAVPLPRAFASILTRAQKEHGAGNQQPQQEAQGESSQLQPRTSQEPGELAPMSDMMDMRTLMPTPFRRMADHMMQMQREMDSLMGAFGMPSPMMMADPWDIFDRAATAPLVARRAGGPMALPRMLPLEVAADEKGYTVTAEVPGFDKGDIKISLSEDGVLTMTGRHEESSPATAGEEVGAAAKEGGGEAAKQRAGTTGGFRRYASFTRAVQLPDDADTSGITATTQHGVLTVVIPKVEKPAPKVREIPIA